MNEYLRAPKSDVTIGRVIGENEDGITLFIPKDLNGEFHLEGGETFLSLIFVKSNGRGDGRGGMMTWVPWADGPVIKS